MPTARVGKTLTSAALSLAIFFNYNEQPVWGGPVAFFMLMGGLGVTLLWVRFLADDISF